MTTTTVSTNQSHQCQHCQRQQQDFYFSYTYDLTHSLQHNMSVASTRTFPLPPCKAMYAWNWYLTSSLQECLGTVNASYWVSE
jgi:hypothetical protein